MERKASLVTDRGSAPAQTGRKTHKSTPLTPKDEDPVKIDEPKRLTTLDMLKESREILDKQGLMGGWEKLTDKSIIFALKQLDSKYGTKMTPELRKALLAISVCLSQITPLEPMVSKMLIEDISKKIADNIEVKLNTKLQYLEETTSKIQEIIKDASKNLDEVAKTSNNLNTTVSTYKDALLTPAATLQRKYTTAPLFNPADPRITRDSERKARQILIDSANRDFLNQSIEALKDKLNAAIRKAPPPIPMDVEIQEICKLRNGGIIVQFKTKEAAEWLKDPETELMVLTEFDSTATIKERTYQMIVPRVPTTFDPTDEDSIKEIEETNCVKKGTIKRAKWIKPIYRRAPGQQFAYLALTLSSPETANLLIRDGIYIRGARSFPHKAKIEPKQCLKCRRWGHYAADCMEDRDMCGNCTDIRKTYILLYHAFLCFIMLFCALSCFFVLYHAFLCFIMLYHAFSCFSVKAREKYKKSNPPYFSKCLGIWLKK